jgi:hypothetical protein
MLKKFLKNREYKELPDDKFTGYLIKLDKTDAIISEHKDSIIVDVKITTLPDFMVEKAAILMASLNMHSVPGFFCLTETGLLLYRIFFFIDDLTEDQVLRLMNRYIEEGERDVSLCLKGLAEKMFLQASFNPEEAN